MFEIKIDGAKELQDHFDKMIKTAEELEKGKSVPINELMTNDFVKEHTNHDTFESYIIKSGLVPKGEELTEEILNSGEFTEYVQNTTDFESWEKMLGAAFKKYISKQFSF